MKRIITIAAMLVLTVTLSAQGDATTFLGIPVDGPRASVIRSLEDKGFVRSGRDVLTGDVDGKRHTVRVMAHKGKVYRIAVTEENGTTVVGIAVQKYNTLIGQYKDSSDYTEYETNRLISVTDNGSHRRNIAEGWYYAEFFQKADPQLYDRLVSVTITDEDGDYRIRRCYDNIKNSPEER